jgi:hypothetical protein
MANTQNIQTMIADKFNANDLADMKPEAGALPACFLPSSMGEAMEFAKLMSVTMSVPPHLRSKPGDCLMVLMQSVRWGMEPFAVALKSYFVNDRIAYEAQLVNAVVNVRAPLEGRLKVEWSGEGESLKCTVTGTIKGDPEPHEVEQEIKTITTRNSPLWKQAPRQQLAYYTTRLWARLYTPEVLLGVYTPDELEGDKYRGPEKAKDVTPPRPTRSDPKPDLAAANAETSVSNDAMVAGREDDPGTFPLVDQFGEVKGEYAPGEWTDEFCRLVDGCNLDIALSTLVENNAKAIAWATPLLDQPAVIDEAIAKQKATLEKAG